MFWLSLVSMSYIIILPPKKCFYVLNQLRLVSVTCSVSTKMWALWAESIEKTIRQTVVPVVTSEIGITQEASRRKILKDTQRLLPQFPLRYLEKSFKNLLYFFDFSSFNPPPRYPTNSQIFLFLLPKMGLRLTNLSLCAKQLPVTKVQERTAYGRGGGFCSWFQRV